MPLQPLMSPDQLRALADVLSECLTGTEIDETFQMCGLTRVEGPNKRSRVHDALADAQRRHGGSNKVIEFVQCAMSPARYTKRHDDFAERRDDVNKVLAFAGYRLGEDGVVLRVGAAATLSQAEERARSLRTELNRRGVHAQVLLFCRAELLDENYFHAVLEAVKSVTDRVRSMSGLPYDGAKLFDAAFGMGSAPAVLALNSRSSDSERSEHAGFVNLLRFLYSTFRNPAAHEPKIHRPMGQKRALELLTMVSYAHEQLDVVVVIPPHLRGP